MSDERRWLKVLAPLAILGFEIGVAVVVMNASPEVERSVEEPQPPLVEVVVVEQEDVRLDVAAQGSVRPSTEATLVAEVSGTITTVSDQFAEGGFFDVGTMPLEIEITDEARASGLTLLDVARQV